MTTTSSPFGIESGGPDGDVSDARAVVERTGWVDVALVQTTFGAWFESRESRVRVEGYRLAAKLRLGPLAERLAQAVRAETDETSRYAGLAAAADLGIRVEPPAQSGATPPR